MTDKYISLRCLYSMIFLKFSIKSPSHNLIISEPLDSNRSHDLTPYKTMSEDMYTTIACIHDTVYQFTLDAVN